MLGAARSVPSLSRSICSSRLAQIFFDALAARATHRGIEITSKLN